MSQYSDMIKAALDEGDLRIAHKSNGGSCKSLKHSELGRGSFGVTYRCARTGGNGDQGNYAVKLIDLEKLRTEHGSEFKPERVNREVKALSKLATGNFIVQYHDTYKFPRKSKKPQFLVIRMELCGETLESRFPQLQLDVAKIHKLLTQLAVAFSHLEQQIIVHRDLRLDNCCVAHNSNDLRPQICSLIPTLF